MSRTLSLSFVLGFTLFGLACGEKEDDSGDEEVEKGDSGEESDADADADTDADADADTDADSDADADPPYADGTFQVFENDGNTDTCRLKWLGTGEKSATSCDGCTFVFDYTFTEESDSTAPGGTYCANVKGFLGTLSPLTFARMPDDQGTTGFGLHYAYSYNGGDPSFYGLAGESASPSQGEDGRFIYQFDFSYTGGGLTQGLDADFNVDQAP